MSNASPMLAKSGAFAYPALALSVSLSPSSYSTKRVQPQNISRTLAESIRYKKRTKSVHLRVKKSVPGLNSSLLRQFHGSSAVFPFGCDAPLMHFRCKHGALQRASGKITRAYPRDSPNQDFRVRENLGWHSSRRTATSIGGSRSTGGLDVCL